MSEFNISVIIPAYNSQKTIGKTIEAVLAQEDIAPLEIIVVDDGSKDDTPNIIRSFSNVKYIYQENAGPATARNRGAKEAQGNVLFFTDSDCIPHPDWIKKMIGHLSDPNIAVVAGSYGICNEKSLLAFCIHQEILYRHKNLLPKFTRVLGSYNFCIKSQVFDEVGGFDVTYRNASGEDNDLSYKILAAGKKIVFEGDAKVDHYHPEVLSKYLLEQYRHGFWRAKMYITHPKMVGGDDYTFWKDIVEVPLVFLFFGLLLINFFHDVQSLLVIILVLFTMFEIVFGSIILNSPIKGIFFGIVMLLRSFSRSLGFLLGILVNSYLKITKKP